MKKPTAHRTRPRTSQTAIQDRLAPVGTLFTAVRFAHRRPCRGKAVIIKLIIGIVIIVIVLILAWQRGKAIAVCLLGGIAPLWTDAGRPSFYRALVRLDALVGDRIFSKHLAGMVNADAGFPVFLRFLLVERLTVRFQIFLAACAPLVQMDHFLAERFFFLRLITCGNEFFHRGLGIRIVI